jgi:hypothetical protein
MVIGQSVVVMHASLIGIRVLVRNSLGSIWVADEYRSYKNTGVNELALCILVSPSLYKKMR